MVDDSDNGAIDGTEILPEQELSGAPFLHQKHSVSNPRINHINGHDGFSALSAGKIQWLNHE